MAKNKMYEWFEGTSVGCWYIDHIGCRITNLQVWWCDEVHTLHYLGKATENIIAANYDVLPETIKVYSWRRLWVPILIKVTMVPASGYIWDRAYRLRESGKSGNLGFFGAGNVWWVYLVRNNNWYVINKAREAEQVRQYVYPTKEELAGEITDG
jgi:hypothetical protein